MRAADRSLTRVAFLSSAGAFGRHCALGLGVWLLVAFGGAGEALSMQLRSRSLVVHPDEQLLVATGAVRGRSDAFTAYCDRAHAHYEIIDGRRTITRLEMEGAVRVIRRSDGADARSAFAVWSRGDERLIMTGDPVVRQGEDVLNGEVIVVGTADDRIDVEAPVVLLLNGRQTPVNVTARLMEVPPGGEVAIFLGDVVIREGEGVATSRRADALLAAQGEGEARALSKMILTGDVVVVRGGQRSRSERAEWETESGDMVLEGAPVLEEDGESVQGKRITIDGATGRARVESATVRLKRSR